jgi:hypothetical protein
MLFSGQFAISPSLFGLPLLEFDADINNYLGG